MAKSRSREHVVEVTVRMLVPLRTTPRSAARMLKTVIRAGEQACLEMYKFENANRDFRLLADSYIDKPIPITTIELNLRS